MGRAGGHEMRFQRLVLAFLLGALVLTGLLLYQAYQAQKSYRRAVDRAMRDYTMVATWQLMTHMRSDVGNAVFSAFAGASRQLTPRFAPGELSVFAEIAGAAPPCGCLSGVLAFVRVDPRSGAFTTEPAMDTSTAAMSWAAAAMRTHLRDPRTIPRRRPPQVDVRGPVPPQGRGAPPRPTARGVSHGTIYQRVGSADLAVAFAVLRDTGGRPLDAFGVVTSAEAFLTPILQRVLRNEQLLPPGITGSADSNTMVSARIRSPSGGVLFRHAGTAAPDYWHTDSLPSLSGGLRVSVGLDPALSRRLVQPSANGRVPVALILFLLTAGLIVAALLQLRRQSAFFRARSDFLAGVSHELRTPLTQIRLRAELLKMGKPPVAHAAQRSLDIIDKEARRLSYLVDNILSFTRVERGLNRIAPRLVSLDAEIAEAVEAFAPLAAAREVRIRTQSAADIRAHLDPAALRQALLNLLDNAVRYGPQGGTVTVGARDVPERETVQIHVDDEGPGVPGDERMKIWEPYYRMPRDAASHHGGSGLGLAVVADLVERHGGRAWVETPVANRGTRVVLEFPIEAAASERSHSTNGTGEHQA